MTENSESVIFRTLSWERKVKIKKLCSIPNFNTLTQQD